MFPQRQDVCQPDDGLADKVNADIYPNYGTLVFPNIDRSLKISLPRE